MGCCESSYEYEARRRANMGRVVPVVQTAPVVVGGGHHRPVHRPEVVISTGGHHGRVGHHGYSGYSNGHHTVYSGVHHDLY